MQIENVVKNFEKRGFVAKFFKTSEEAVEFVSRTIGSGASVGIGGSVTVSEIGLYDVLAKNNKVYWHAAPDRDENTMRNAADAQYYITSANALSASGEIVNIDGRGNRVAASIYGVDRKAVFFVCGINKLEENLEKAMWRAKNIAAPKNAQRLGRKTPCAVKADKCYNCQSPDKICCAYSIIAHPTFSNPAYVIIIDAKLGY